MNVKVGDQGLEISQSIIAAKAVARDISVHSSLNAAHYGLLPLFVSSLSDLAGISANERRTASSFSVEGKDLRRTVLEPLSGVCRGM